jgi:radical S-adenosyl methionine domain-containing protein 2
MSEIPDLINWSITNDCYLSCKFCFRLPESNPKKEIKFEIYSKILSSGVKRITFTGGDPLIDSDLPSLLSLCKRDNIFSSIHTTGLMLNPLQKIAPIADRISLSLDGPDKLVNYKMRGTSTFYEKVLKRLYYLKSINKDFAIKTTVTRQNIESIHKMIPLINEFQPTFWSLLEFRPLRIGSINNKLFKLKTGEFDRFVKSLIGVNVKLNILSNTDAMSHPIFLISGDGLVYTNSKISGDYIIGSLHSNTIQELWKIILSNNSISEKYLSKIETITQHK